MKKETKAIAIKIVIAATILLLSLGLIKLLAGVIISGNENEKGSRVAQVEAIPEEGVIIGQEICKELVELEALEDLLALEAADATEELDTTIDEGVIVEGIPNTFLYCSDMYGNFQAEWFQTEWSLTLGEQKPPILSEADLDDLQTQISGNSDIKYIFLEISPEIACSEKAQNLFATYADVFFYIFFPVYEASFWMDSSNNEQQLNQLYRKSESVLLTISNVYCFSLYKQPWLINNVNNFDESGYFSKGACLEIFHAFNNHQYVIRSEEDIKTPIPKEKYNRTLIENSIGFIFGDSIWGLEKDSTGIAEILGGMQGIHMVNFAVGGASATSTINNMFMNDESQRIENLQNLSGQIDQMLKTYGAIYPEYVFLEFGLNDYFQQEVIEDHANKMNSHTYKGAIRTAIERIRGKYPGTQIILLGPSTMYLYESGRLNMEEQGTLKDYEIALTQIAKEYSIPIQYNYDTDEFTIENMGKYLKEDNCHLNANGRYAYAKRLYWFMCK